MLNGLHGESFEHSWTVKIHCVIHSSSYYPVYYENNSESHWIFALLIEWIFKCYHQVHAFDIQFLILNCKQSPRVSKNRINFIQNAQYIAMYCSMFVAELETRKTHSTQWMLDFLKTSIYPCSKTYLTFICIVV